MKPLLTILFLILLLPAISHGQTTKNACKDSSIDDAYYLNNSSLDIYKSITTKDDGKLLITVSDFNPAPTTYSITKLTPVGTVKWNRVIKPSNTNEFIQIQNLLELRDGGFIIGGARNFPDYSAPTYFFLMRFDNNGNLLWQHKYKNNYNPPANNTETEFTSFNEGENGEIIGIIRDGRQGAQTILRFDASGNVIWSNSYTGQSIFCDYTNNYNNGTIDLWGFGNGINCFSSYLNQSLASIQLNYTDGSISGYKSFCGRSISQSEFYISDFKGYTLTKRLPNKNTVDILNTNTGSLLINVFDSNLNCIKSKLYTPPDMHSLTYGQQAYYSYDVSDNGEVAFCVQIEYSHPFRTYLPYQPLILLDTNLNIKQEYVIHSPDLPYNSGPFPLKFTPSGKIAFLAVGYPAVNPNFQSFTLVTMPTNTKASAICYTADTLFGSFSNYGLVANNETLNGVTIVKKIYSLDGSPNLVIGSLPILQTTSCSNVSICDTLKIHGKASYCLSNDTATFRVYKNSHCQRTINWQTDTSMATILPTINDTTVQVKFKKPGVLWLYAAINNCVIKDSLKITINNPRQSFALNKDSLLCPGKNITLQATNGFATYQWQDGSIQDNFLATQPGFYKVKATDSCGNIFADSLTIHLVDTAFTIAPQQTICNSDTITIKIPKGISTILWLPATGISTSGSQLFFYPSQSTNYIINAIKYPNCALVKSIQIIVTNCPENIFFPNSFTPNNDRLNDFFKPSVTRPLYFYQLTIYNRFGQKLFETNNLLTGWNGIYKNTEQSPGAYIYQCSYQFKNSLPKYKKGFCLLLR